MRYAICNTVNNFHLNHTPGAFLHRLYTIPKDKPACFSAYLEKNYLKIHTQLDLFQHRFIHLFHIKKLLVSLNQISSVVSNDLTLVMKVKITSSNANKNQP